MYFENRRLEEFTHAVQIVANLHVHKIDLLDLGSAIIRSAKSTKSNNIPDPNPMPIKDGLRSLKHEKTFVGGDAPPNERRAVAKANHVRKS